MENTDHLPVFLFRSKEPEALYCVTADVDSMGECTGYRMFVGATALEGGGVLLDKEVKIKQVPEGYRDGRKTIVTAEGPLVAYLYSGDPREASNPTTFRGVELTLIDLEAETYEVTPLPPEAPDRVIVTETPSA